MPKISVVMSVYNTERYLREAIESILKQTFTDFEFIIINDCSTDKSEEIIKSYNDSRIIYLKNEENLGRAATPNRGIEMAKGEFIARMDSDDISLPQRLEMQYRFMKKHPDIGICGSWMKVIATGKTEKMPSRPDVIAASFIFETQLFNPTLFWRTESARRHQLLYDSSLREAEDYEFLARASGFLKMANVKKILLNYRTTNQKFNYSDNLKTSQRISSTARRHLLNRLLPDISAGEQEIHERISANAIGGDDNLVRRAESWFIKLISANDQKKVYGVTAFKEVLRQRWLTIIRRSQKDNLSKFKLLLDSPLFGRNKPERIANMLILAIKIKLS